MITIIGDLPGYLSAQASSHCFSILHVSHWPRTYFRYPRRAQMAQDVYLGTSDLRPSFQSLGHGEIFAYLNSTEDSLDKRFLA